KRLSPQEQRDLARQYGVALPPGTAAPLPKTAEIENEPLVQNRIGDSDPEVLREPQKESDLKRFGAQLFSGDLETYAPLDRALAPSGYLLGPGDELSIQVFGKDPIETFVQVDRTGQITIPKIGAISVAGLTFEEAKRVIANSISTRLIGSEVVTALGSLRQISIFLAGEVNAPGNYNVSALTSISQALYMSGGLTSIGSFRNIQVRRGGATVTEFDFYDLLLKGQRDNDITLQSGDTVFVPVAHSIVSIDGAIKRPALYELKGRESFKEVVDMAGGLTATAFEQMSTIRRFDSEKGYPVVLTINDPFSDLSIIDGDVITIKEGTRQLANAIELKGAVVRPGVYAHSEGARISDYIGFIDRDLMNDADL
ncbi:MAG: SLBB domain-containing protein, partial [Pseudomonadales bacterium]